MDNPDNKNDEEGCWRPLYDGVRQSHGHGYNMIDAWVYWFIFNPQVDYSVIGGPKTDGLTDVAIVTAMSRADAAYWHEKTMSCLKNSFIGWIFRDNYIVTISGIREDFKDTIY